MAEEIVKLGDCMKKSKTFKFYSGISRLGVGQASAPQCHQLSMEAITVLLIWLKRVGEQVSQPVLARIHMEVDRLVAVKGGQLYMLPDCVLDPVHLFIMFITPSELSLASQLPQLRHVVLKVWAPGS